MSILSLLGQSELQNLEIERKLREMEQSQKAAWEEKERLSRALVSVT